MKPEDLKSPFKWDERHVAVHDRVWYVPSRCVDYNAFAFPGWRSSDFFEKDQPVVVEYCCGNGAWIAAKAQQFPDMNWLGVERRFERVRKVWSKVKNLNLPNLMVLCGEALQSTQLYFPAQSVSEIYVNFPDPWPKKRHAKNRLLQGEFILQLKRILNSSGRVVVATDDAPYSDQLIQEFADSGVFHSAFSDPSYVTDWPDYGDSYFDALWREKGRTIRYHRFELR
jgi:tRNA (guanine-N7-)-methyltransferase